MELRSMKEKLNAGFKKYKYAVLVLLIGLGFMLIPAGREDSDELNKHSVQETSTPSTEERLEQILSKIQGAGEVDVLLTQVKGERVQYQTDMDASDSESASSNRVNTVVITDAQRNESGLVVQIEPPVYMGAIVVSKGADDPSVKFAIVEAVSKVTGLGANQITVLKMK